MGMDAQYLIEHLKLKPLPNEGGYFRETYRSDEIIPHAELPPRYQVRLQPIDDRHDAAAAITVTAWSAVTGARSAQHVARVPCLRRGRSYP